MQMHKRALAGLHHQPGGTRNLSVCNSAVGDNRSPALTCCVAEIQWPIVFCGLQEIFCGFERKGRSVVQGEAEALCLTALNVYGNATGSPQSKPSQIQVHLGSAAIQTALFISYRYGSRQATPVAGMNHPGRA